MLEIESIAQHLPVAGLGNRWKCVPDRCVLPRRVSTVDSDRWWCHPRISHRSPWARPSERPSRCDTPPTPPGRRTLVSRGFGTFGERERECVCVVTQTIGTPTKTKLVKRDTTQWAWSHGRRCTFIPRGRKVRSTRKERKRKFWLVRERSTEGCFVLFSIVWPPSLSLVVYIISIFASWSLLPSRPSTQMDCLKSHGNFT